MAHFPSVCVHVWCGLSLFQQESGCLSGSCAKLLKLSVSCCQKSLSQLKHVAAEEKPEVSDFFFFWHLNTAMFYLKGSSILHFYIFEGRFYESIVHTLTFVEKRLKKHTYKRFDAKFLHCFSQWTFRLNCQASGFPDSTTYLPKKKRSLLNTIALQVTRFSQRV